MTLSTLFSLWPVAVLLLCAIVLGDSLGTYYTHRRRIRERINQIISDTRNHRS